MSFAFEQRLLGRHDVAYFSCGGCGLLRTEAPHWLDEAYASAIAPADTGLVQRNLELARVSTALLHHLFRGEGRIVDVAGGYGLFTRLMRDNGFDAWWSDKYCENRLAVGFEAEPGPHAAVTAWEVLEHVHEPLQFGREQLEAWQTRTFLFSTTLFEGAPPAPGSWWYYAPESGQHITFYQRRTLAKLAAALGLRFLSRGSVHLFTDQPLGERVFALLAGRASHLAARRARRRLGTRAQSDHELLVARARRPTP
jgi:hypothetical protein